MLQSAQGQQILQASNGQQIVVPIQGQAQQQTIQVRIFILTFLYENIFKRCR